VAPQNQFDPGLPDAEGPQGFGTIRHDGGKRWRRNDTAEIA
jgi:hypothetical protein